MSMLISMHKLEFFDLKVSGDFNIINSVNCSLSRIIDSFEHYPVSIYIFCPHHKKFFDKKT